VAILAVVFTHVFPNLNGSLAAIFPPGWFAEWSGKTALFPLGSFFTNARVGVNLFFVLSGFVLYLPYALSSRKMEGLGDGIKFYQHRFGRLMPLFLINAVITVIWFYYLHPINPKFLFKQWLLVVSCTSAFYNFFPIFNFVLWTLVLEIWFSLLFVPLCFLIQRQGMARVVTAVFVLALIVRLMGTRFCQDSSPNPYFNAVSDSILGRLDDFLVGMVVAGSYASRRTIAFSRRSGWGFVVLGILLVWTGMALWDATLYLKLSGRYEGFYNLFLNTGFGALLWGCICLRSAGKGWPATFLQNYPLQLLGMMCYSIYIWHGILIDFTEYEETWLSLLKYLFFMLIVSAISYRYIEFARTRDWRELLPRKESTT
jgi:peptidoglycan/LPS O-acetylase OafA/YrhL